MSAEEDSNGFPGGDAASSDVRTDTRIDVADVVRRPGAERRSRLRVELADLDLALARVAGPVEADLRLEGVLDGVVVSGEVRAPVELQCRRCARTAPDLLAVDAVELFTDDAELLADADVYPVDGTIVDVEQYLRDAVGLELPDAPLLCEGDPDQCPYRPDISTDASAEATADPRWEPLRKLAEEL